MGRSGRNEQGLASLERDRRPALKVIFQRPIKNVGDLFAWMRVSGGRHSRREIDARLDDLSSGLAKIVLQDIGAADASGLHDLISRLLRLRQLHRQSASNEQHRGC